MLEKAKNTLSMTFDISEQEITVLYNKARESYAKCIGANENLEEEITIPFEKIELKNEDIKIVFNGDTSNGFSVETTITLWDTNKMIGKYTYVEDDKGNAWDDILVFY